MGIHDNIMFFLGVYKIYIWTTSLNGEFVLFSKKNVNIVSSFTYLIFTVTMKALCRAPSNDLCSTEYIDRVLWLLEFPVSSLHTEQGAHIRLRVEFSSYSKPHTLLPTVFSWKAFLFLLNLVCMLGHQTELHQIDLA